VGILELIWHFTAQFAPAGDIGRWTDVQIAEAVYWQGEATVLVEALVSAGWLDSHREHRLVVHDWWEHSEDSLHKRLARSVERFATGEVPKLSQFSRVEQERIREAYQAQENQACAENENGGAFLGPRRGPCQGQGQGQGLSLSHSPGQGQGHAGARGEPPPGDGTPELAAKNAKSRNPAPAAPSGSESGSKSRGKAEPKGRKPRVGPKSEPAPSDGDDSACPAWATVEDWGEARRLAQLIEGAETGHDVAGIGGYERVCKLAMMLQDAGKGAVMKLARSRAVWTVEQLAKHWRRSAELEKVLVELQTYPDGVYPNRQGKAPVSRIELAYRLLMQMDGKSFRQTQEGFVHIGEIQ
jgi:hypothetical protein